MKHTPGPVETLARLAVQSACYEDDPDDYPDQQLYRMVQDATEQGDAAIANATKETTP